MRLLFEVPDQVRDGTYMTGPIRRGLCDGAYSTGPICGGLFHKSPRRAHSALRFSGGLLGGFRLLAFFC